ncbi:MAG: ORF6N domain-containing protein [Candidatus Brocadiae bacterium]|nr:ORF6N domain-containing protein [Candidatus Brocadiia bacterium]
MITTITIENKEYPVLTLPGRPIALLDSVVAEIYGVQTKHINQAVKNNREKFPADFCFQLTQDEVLESIQEADRYDTLKKSNFLPFAFTHLGCNMLSTILKSETAVLRTVLIIRAFTALESKNIVPSSLDDPLQMIEAQSKMICALAQEMYKNKKQIESHIKACDQEIHSIHKQLTCMDIRVSGLENGNVPKGKAISSLQCGTLRGLVKQKCSNKKQMGQVWLDFKRHFDLTRYVHLPKEKFDEACKWLKAYQPVV